jgi:hypothetical protein
MSIDCIERHRVPGHCSLLWCTAIVHANPSGRTPRLDDNLTFGGRYNYNFTDTWGIQLSGGYSPNRASRIVSGNSDLGLTTADLDAVVNITPQAPIVIYALAGAGYGWALKLGTGT